MLNNFLNNHSYEAGLNLSSINDHSQFSSI